MNKKKYVIILLSLVLFSCKSNNNFDTQNQFENTFQESILERPLPDSRGIITYKDYQILVAKGDETVEQIANRLNINPKRLASYNGVVLTYLPRVEEVLALPIKISGKVINPNSEWNIESTRKSIENIGNLNTNIGTPDNPLKHRVEIGDTAYSIARLYNVSVTSLSKWNGLDADCRELIIPVILNNKNFKNPEIKVPTTKPTPPTSTETNNNLSLNKTKLKKESHSSEKNGVNNQTNVTKESQSNEIIQKFIRPVNGIILRKYNPTAINNKNEGIDFAAKPGTPVKSTATGVVALISEPVGGLGKIILIKHKESIISIYGRISEIKVVKGERVQAGQVIGNVEKSFINEDGTEKKQNYLHFELRKGTESLDPEPLFE